MVLPRPVFILVAAATCVTWIVVLAMIGIAAAYGGNLLNGLLGAGMLGMSSPNLLFGVALIVLTKVVILVMGTLVLIQRLRRNASAERRLCRMGLRLFMGVAVLQFIIPLLALGWPMLSVWIFLLPQVLGSLPETLLTLGVLVLALRALDEPVSEVF